MLALFAQGPHRIYALQFATVHTGMCHSFTSPVGSYFISGLFLLFLTDSQIQSLRAGNVPYSKDFQTLLHIKSPCSVYKSLYPAYVQCQLSKNLWGRAQPSVLFLNSLDDFNMQTCLRTWGYCYKCIF